MSYLQEYLSKSSVIVAEDVQEPTRDPETSSLLEFKNLAKFDAKEGMRDETWSETGYALLIQSTSIRTQRKSLRR